MVWDVKSAVNLISG